MDADKIIQQYETKLINEAKRLKDIMQRYIDDYYNSYSPTVYDRGNHGGNLRESLAVDDVFRVSVDNAHIYLDVIVNDNAIHQSVVSGKDSNAFWLINDGWQVKKDVWFKDMAHFGYFEGAHFVEQAIDEFKRTSKYPDLTVEVIRPLLYY